MKNITIILLCCFSLSCTYIEPDPRLSSSSPDPSDSSESPEFPANEGAADSSPLSGGSSFTWEDGFLLHSPLDELNQGLSFGKQNAAFNNQYHLGQDLMDAQYSPVYAIGDGTIVFNNFYPNRTFEKNGQMVTIQSWGGISVLQIDEPEQFFVIYGHLDKDNLLPVGTKVTKGQVISRIESDKVHTWPTHIHFQVGQGKFNNKVPAGYIPNLANNVIYVDPFPYLTKFKKQNPQPPTLAELPNGIDDNFNEIIDDGPDCWMAIYRFTDKATGARCWNNSVNPPAGYSHYTIEIEAWIAARNNIPNTFHLVQCSMLTDHILLEKNSADYYSLINAGYTETADLGYVWRLNKAERSLKYLNAQQQVAPVYRFSYTAGNTGAHLFSRGADVLHNLICESPARFEVLTAHEVFPFPPCN